MLHSMGNRQFFDDAALHASIASKIRAKAHSKRVNLDEGHQGQYRAGEGPGPGGGEGASGETSFSSLAIALTDERARIDANGDVVMLAGDDSSPFKSPPPSSDKPKVMIHQVSWDDTESVTDIDKVIQDSLKRNDGFFPQSMSKEKPYGSVNRHAPTPYRSPGPAGKTANRLLRRNHADRIGKSEVE